MDPFIISQSIDLRRENLPMRYEQPLLKGNKNAHEWRVRVTDGGKTADLSGVTAKLWYTYSAEGAQEDVSAVADAEIAGNIASIVFPASCYARTGEAIAVMELTSGETVVGVAVLALHIRETKAGVAIETGGDDSSTDVSGVLEAIANARAAANAANTAANAANKAAADIQAAKKNGEFNGADGFSPSITLTRISGGVRITATNADGEQTAIVYDGADGAGSGGASEAETEIPNYWQTHLDERVLQIRAAMAAAGFNKSAFLWYHDVHWTYGYKRAPMLLKYLYEHTPINKTNFGGDVIDAEGDDTMMAYLWDWRDAIRDLPNHHSVPGNHDDGNTIDNRFDDPYIYAYLLAAEETPDVVRGDAGLYYYVDVPTEKTRYLYLDTATKDGNILNDTAQQAWLKAALIDTPDGWHIVAIAHIWRVYGENYVDAGWGYGAKMALDMFDAYNARTGDYASCTGKVEFCIGGHTHVDADHYSDGGILVMLTECDSRNVRSGLDCTEGTITEASVNAIIADYANDKVNVIRIGRGSSRVVALTEGGDTGGDDGSGEEGGGESGGDSGTDAPTIPEGDYTNQLTAAGYTENVRYSSSSQAETTATGWDLTGYIPATRNDVIRFANVNFFDLDGTGGTSRAQVYSFDADKGFIAGSDAYSPSNQMSDAWSPVYGEDGDLIQFTVPSSYSSTVAYIRIGARNIDRYSVITVNEEIG